MLLHMLTACPLKKKKKKREMSKIAIKCSGNFTDSIHACFITYTNLGYGLLLSITGKHDSIFCLTISSFHEVSKSTIFAIRPSSCKAPLRQPFGTQSPSLSLISTTSRVNILLADRTGALASGGLCLFE